MLQLVGGAAESVRSEATICKTSPQSGPLALISTWCLPFGTTAGETDHLIKPLASELDRLMSQTSDRVPGMIMCSLFYLLRVLSVKS